MGDPLKKTIIRSGLETLYFSGLHYVMQPTLGGVGVILMLHHVRPVRNGSFQPNRLLEISPKFFERVLRQLKRDRIEVISLDEMYRRITAGDFSRRFVVITIDDGYKDIKEFAYPLLKKYELPFVVYIPTRFPDQLGELWWLGLESVIAWNSRIDLVVNDDHRHFECATVTQKRKLYDELYGYLRGLETEEELRDVVRKLCARYHVDLAAICRDLSMTWAEIAEMAEDPLVTIGAHTVSHSILKKMSDDAAVRAEMEQCRVALETALGRAPEHLAYPFGDPSAAGPREFRIAADLGFKTAVTTRPGVLFKEHCHHLTALPRISLNGEFQQSRYFKVLMSGAATAMWNRFRRVNAA